MSQVAFKKWQCRPVDFRGQGPQNCTVRETVYYRMEICKVVYYFPSHNKETSNLKFRYFQYLVEYDTYGYIYTETSTNYDLG